jgi:hypothetical protein
MKFMRTVGYTNWDQNEDILMELKIELMTDYIKYYQENWRSHVNKWTLEDFQFYDIDLRGKDR